MKHSLIEDNERGETTAPNIQLQTAPLACNIHESARLLSVSPQMIRKLIRGRRLPRIAKIRKILVARKALEKFANQ